MKVRIIELVNNFYKDDTIKINNSITQKSHQEQPLGTYCCLGHFDALEFRLVDIDNSNHGKYVWEVCNRNEIANLTGKCNRRSIVCVIDDDDKEESFWEQAVLFPCLFVSWVRLNKVEMQYLNETIENINKNVDMVAYYTYDHSELIVIRFGNGYTEGLKNILSLYDSMEVFKMYSVFAVREDALGNGDSISDEIVDCRLSAVVKNRECVDEYLNQLEVSLKEQDVEDSFKVTPFDVLGNGDIMIMISQVSLKRLLGCYKMGRILTHSNKEYQKAFFNVESQILTKYEWEKRWMNGLWRIW